MKRTRHSLLHWLRARTDLLVNKLKGDLCGLSDASASSGKDHIVFGKAIPIHGVDAVHVAAQRGRPKRTSQQEMLLRSLSGPDRVQKDDTSVLYYKPNSMRLTDKPSHQ